VNAASSSTSRHRAAVLIAVLVAAAGVASCSSDAPTSGPDTEASSIAVPSTSPTSPPTSSAPSTIDTASSATSDPGAALELVAIGDSIPFNSPDDCSGCTGFVDQYAEAVGSATGRDVHVTNLSQHTGLTLPQLVDELDTFDAQLSAADVIVVGIAHNSAELNADQPCGKPVVNDLPDWTAIDEQCAKSAAEMYRPQFEQVYSHVAEIRRGKPTILRTINRYNDFIGWPSISLTPDEASKTKLILDPWNTMLCETAVQNGFVCADIYTAFNGTDGLQPSGDLLGHDYTHPSQAGNDLIATVLEDTGYAPLA
jgi:lysophospholipase L1-like esterase